MSSSDTCPCPERIAVVKAVYERAMHEQMAERFRMRHPQMALDDLLDPSPIPPITCTRSCPVEQGRVQQRQHLQQQARSHLQRQHHYTAALADYSQRLQARSTYINQWRAEMANHPAWQHLVQRYRLNLDPAALPSVFQANVPGALRVKVAPALWQAELPYHFLHQQPQTTCTIDDWSDHLIQCFGLPPGWSPRRACDEFWQYLEFVGVIQSGSLFVLSRPMTPWCPCNHRITAAIQHWVQRVREDTARQVLKAYPELTVADLVKPEPMPTYSCRPECTLQRTKD